MKWLLWKEYRHNRLLVFTALFLLLLPHLIALGLKCWAEVYHPGAFHWRVSVAMACIYSIGLSGIALALIGGNAIAGERVERSAEFLFALPIARKKLLASKLLLALVVAAIPWLTNLALLGCLMPMPSRGEPDLNLPGVLAVIAVAEFTAFCVSFCVTSFMASVSFATLAGLLSPPVVCWSLLLIATILGHQGRERDAFMEVWWIICLALAPVCFAVGAWHYLRRVEP
jgi:ABC-type transport system involved in multi-copper enzyme maturation permease subunit